MLRAPAACTFFNSQLPKVLRAEVLLPFWLPHVLHAAIAGTFSTSQLPKVLRSWGAFTLFISKCASCHNGVHFSTSQLPKVIKSFLTFWLGNVLRATMASTFSISQRAKGARSWSAFSIFTSKSASRHNGMLCLISHPATWLRTRRFSKPTFRPFRPRNLGKAQSFAKSFATFLPFRAPWSPLYWLFLFWLFSLLTLSLLWLLSALLLHLSILSEVWLLNFLRSPMATSSIKIIILQPDLWIWPVMNSLARLGFPVITDAPHSWCILPISQHRKTWRQLEGAAAWTSVFLSHGCVHLWLVDDHDGSYTIKSVSNYIYIHILYINI